MVFVMKEQYVLVEFYVFWCGYCQELVFEWVVVVIVFKGCVFVVKVDMILYMSIGEKFSVVSYFMLFFFVDGGYVVYIGEWMK